MFTVNLSSFILPLRDNLDLDILTIRKEVNKEVNGIITALCVLLYCEENYRAICIYFSIYLPISHGL